MFTIGALVAGWFALDAVRPNIFSMPEYFALAGTVCAAGLYTQMDEGLFRSGIGSQSYRPRNLVFYFVIATPIAWAIISAIGK